jgi:hypothetical protein
MAEPTQPTDDNKEPPQPADRPEFMSPYQVFPTEDAAREAVVAAAADGRDQPTPQVAVWDPTKPTIDQTRANAILAIQQNFESLIPIAGIVPAQYLKKTGDTAANLRVTPGNLLVDGGSSIQVQGSAGTIAAGVPAKILEVSGGSTAGDAAYMAFRRPTLWNAYFGIDTDNQWKVGGSSYGAVSYKVLHEGNSFTVDTGLNLTTNKQVTVGGLLANRIKQATASLSGTGGIAVYPVSQFTSYWIAMAGPITISIEAGMVAGNIVRLTIVNTNTGAITWPATVAWPGPTYTPPDFAAGPLKRTLVVLNWDGGSFMANASVY